MPELVMRNAENKSKGPERVGTQQKQTIYLNEAGDLWREPQAKYCYPMGEKSDRHKIIRYLATNRGYRQTSIISSALDEKSEQSIRTEIGKIRKNIKKYLKLNGDEILQGKKESGYRINPEKEIKLK